MSVQQMQRNNKILSQDLFKRDFLKKTLHFYVMEIIIFLAYFKHLFDLQTLLERHIIKQVKFSDCLFETNHRKY